MSNPQMCATARPDDGAGPGPAEATRKTAVACEVCRKQKIRCDMPDAKPPCGRCRKKRLPCTVGRSLQMHMEHDLVWKHEIEQKIHQVEAKLEAILAAGSSTGIDSRGLLSEHASGSGTPVPVPVSITTTATAPAPEPGPIWRLEVDLESSPSSLPGLRLHNSLHAGSQPAPPAADFVSRGVVTLANALRYQAVYQDRLDHFTYGVLAHRSSQTFAELHRQSPTLSTAVCAVGALHVGSDDYEPLRAEFIALTSATCLSRNNDSDYVRALCIGAFWMSDLSSALSSLAVRVATELQLHRRLARAIAGDEYQAYLDARLYYLVYACDHHLSIPHGRPPLTRECEAIRNVRRLLECRHATHDDARLVSHVLRWTVWTDIFDSVGQGSADSALSGTQIQTVKRLGNALDALRLEWADRLGADGHVGNYPWKGAGMQHHFAKLYLCSHVFRGSGGNGGGATGCADTAAGMDVDIYELASSAVLAATCILRTVNSDREVQSFLNGLPTYFHVMIAFAVVFLLKVSTSTTARGAHGPGVMSRVVDADEVRHLLTTSIAVLRDVTRTMHPQHLLVNITESAAEAVLRSYPNNVGGVNAAESSASSIGGDARNHTSSAPAGVQQRGDHADGDHAFSDELLDGFFNAYDFLVDHS
ncbi:RNA polymerase II-specific transcription factor-like protein [Microdochium nivale]|nr:RNA polymerase II-specific transcription factor-like protein [Microdochium nivale]